LWGTFPRVLGRYVRERQVLTLENALYRMTGLSARNFGIQNRGRLAAGSYADICVFDPEAILDMATYEQPIQASRGIRYVLINGQMALEDGVPTGKRAGRVLTREDLRDAA
jgi:N-acyl-D-amino-acid deacylase